MSDDFYNIPHYTAYQVREYVNRVENACIGIYRGTKCLREQIHGTIVARVQTSVIYALLDDKTIRCDPDTIGFLYVRTDRAVDANGYTIQES